MVEAIPAKSFQKSKSFQPILLCKVQSIHYVDKNQFRVVSSDFNWVTMSFTMPKCDDIIDLLLIGTPIGAPGYSNQLSINCYSTRTINWEMLCKDSIDNCIFMIYLFCVEGNRSESIPAFVTKVKLTIAVPIIKSASFTH